MPSCNYPSWVHSHRSLAQCSPLLEMLDVFVLWVPTWQSAVRANSCPVAPSIATIPRTAPHTPHRPGDGLMICGLHNIRRQSGGVSKEAPASPVRLLRHTVSYFIHLTSECHNVFPTFFSYQQNHSFSLLYAVIVLSVVLNVIREYHICILGIERGSWCIMSRLLFESIVRGR